MDYYGPWREQGAGSVLVSWADLSSREIKIAKKAFNNILRNFILKIFFLNFL